MQTAASSRLHSNNSNRKKYLNYYSKSSRKSQASKKRIKRVIRRSDYKNHISIRLPVTQQINESCRVVQEKIKANKLVSFVGILIIICGIIYGLNLLLQNRAAVEIAEDQIAAAQQFGGDDGNPDTPQPAIVIPSSDKPSREDVLAYTAAANQPKRIEINNIEVFARVKPVGLNSKGEVGVPVNIYDASWFNQSSAVGDSPGSSVIVGHVGFRSIAGVFHDLDELNKNDIIKITMGDDREITYRVTESEEVKLNDFNMSKYLSYNSSPNAKLHLITCTGSIIPGSTTYDSRYVVSAEIM